MSDTKSYNVAIAIHGHIHYAVEAESKAEAIEKAYEKYEGGQEADDIEWETGFPCEIAWDEADAIGHDE